MMKAKQVLQAKKEEEKLNQPIKVQSQTATNI